MQILRIILLLLLYILTSATHFFESQTADYSKRFPLGTANTPVGRTIVVSIFCDDENYSWDFDSKIDRNTVDKTNRYLQIAGDYIENIAKDYGKEAEFITDFQENQDLFYRVFLDCDMSDEDSRDYCVWKYIDKNIDTDTLMEKYDADNLIFFLVNNTDWNNDTITSTRDWYEGMEYPYEIVYLFTIDDKEANCPAVYAHEMLHTFGAPDLYAPDEYYGIDKKTVKYIGDNIPNELMYSCSDAHSQRYLYDRITNEVSEITAYYIGLIDESELVSELGLYTSQHVQ